MTLQESKEQSSRQSSQPELTQLQQNQKPVMSQQLLVHEKTILKLESGSHQSCISQAEDDCDMSAPISMSEAQYQQPSHSYEVIEPSSQTLLTHEEVESNFEQNFVADFSFIF